MIPLVSVVSSFYNRKDSVELSISSLLNQSVFSETEVILIDDGSTDGTGEILRKFRSPGVKVIAQSKMGLTKVFRKYFAQAKGKYLAVHGAGDISHTGRLEKQISLLESSPALGMVSCHFKKISLINNADTIIRPDPVYRNPRKVGFNFSHGEVMYRSEAYHGAGGYREFFTVGQGTDLWRRIIKQWDIGVVPEILYTQRIFSDGVSADFDKLLLRRLLHAISADADLQLNKTGINPIDMYGQHALLFLNEDVNQTKARIWSALFLMAEGRPKEANRILETRPRSMHRVWIPLVRMMAKTPVTRKFASIVVSSSSAYKRYKADTAE